MSNNNLTTTILPNGLKVLVKEMHHAPVASFWVWYRVGSRNEMTGRTGISHWVEHMLFKGTPTFPKGEIDRQIARDGGYMNGMTWIDWTTYFETLPADRFDLALRIEADRMQNSLFNPAEVDAERTVIISEREGHENSPQWLLGEEVQAAVFRVHSYHHEVLGHKCDLLAMTRQDLWDHYRTYYTPNNALAVAVGDFDTRAVLDRIEQLLGVIEPGPTVPPVCGAEPPQRGERRVTVTGPDKTAYLQMAFHAPNARDEDFFPMVVLDTNLGGVGSMSLFGGGANNKSSRLYRALVDTQLASAVYSSFVPTIDPYIYGAGATVRTGRMLQEVEDALWAELHRIADEPISQAELTKAIKQTRAQFAYATESVTNQAYWLGFSEALADHTWFETYLDRLIRVTAEDVQRVAQKYLTLANQTVGWYVPEDDRVTR
jgi:zinc protease